MHLFPSCCLFFFHLLFFVFLSHSLSLPFRIISIETEEDVYVLSVFCSCTNYLFIIICSIKSFVQVTCTHFQMRCLRRLIKLLTYALFYECHDIYLRTFLCMICAFSFSLFPSLFVFLLVVPIYLSLILSLFHRDLTFIRQRDRLGHRKSWHVQHRNRKKIYVEEGRVYRSWSRLEKVNLHFSTLSFMSCI